MSGLQIAPSLVLEPPFTVRFDWMFSAVKGDPQDHRLANAVVIALNTDRRANPDDVLPDPRQTDRRGWWADKDAERIWKGWPVGTRLWLLSRAKLPGGTREGPTIERARRYIREALDPFVAAKIASRYALDLRQETPERIGGDITMFRGPRAAVALRFQDLWADFGG